MRLNAFLVVNVVLVQHLEVFGEVKGLAFRRGDLKVVGVFEVGVVLVVLLRLLLDAVGVYAVSVLLLLLQLLLELLLLLFTGLIQGPTAETLLELVTFEGVRWGVLLTAGEIVLDSSFEGVLLALANFEGVVVLELVPPGVV